MRGRFISFEGSDGAGKTSVLQQVQAELRAQVGAANLLLTREPGGDPIAEQVRAVLLDRRNTAMDAWTEALLYAAARRQHVVEDIQPALRAGKLVVCDRYLDSSLAYQGGGRQLGIAAVRQINQPAVQGCLPDLTIWLDLPVEEGLARIAQGRANTINRLDQQTLAFYQRVRAAYQELQAAAPDRIVTIDARQEPDQVLAAVRAAIHARFADLLPAKGGD